eukprot:312499-Prorocentrum_minimum.AAC.1
MSVHDPNTIPTKWHPLYSPYWPTLITTLTLTLTAGWGGVDAEGPGSGSRPDARPAGLQQPGQHVLLELRAAGDGASGAAAGVLSRGQALAHNVPRAPRRPLRRLPW